jgi:flavin-dependent dehydrogenase
MLKDVIVVGGNVAGLRCAEILARSNVDVTVFEKEKRGYSKLCGGGYTKGAMREMQVPPERGYLTHLDPPEYVHLRSLENHIESSYIA